MNDVQLVQALAQLAEAWRPIQEITNPALAARARQVGEQGFALQVIVEQKARSLEAGRESRKETASSTRGLSAARTHWDRLAREELQVFYLGCTPAQVAVTTSRIGLRA